MEQGEKGEFKKSTLYILEATSDVSQELQARLAFASWKSFARHHAVIYRTLGYLYLQLYLYVWFQMLGIAIFIWNYNLY